MGLFLKLDARREPLCRAKSKISFIQGFEGIYQTRVVYQQFFQASSFADRKINRGRVSTCLLTHT